MSGARKKTAVVVNDDITQLVFISGVLQKKGFTVLTSPSAPGALSILVDQGPPAVIVTDVEMPGMDGWELCRILRSSEYPEFNGVPIVVVSAVYSGGKTRSICGALGANAFLQVPFSGPRLMETVESVLSGESPACAVVRSIVVAGSRSQADELAAALPEGEYETSPITHSGFSRTTLSSFRPDLVIMEAREEKDDITRCLAWIEELQIKPVVIAALQDFDQQRTARLLRQGVEACVPLPVHADYLRLVCEKSRREQALRDMERLLNRRTCEVREREQWYQNILAATDDMVYVVSPEFRLEYTNRALTEKVGADALQKRCFDRIYGLKAPCGWCPMKHVQQGRRAQYEPEERLYGRSYHVGYSPIPRPDGSVSAMAVMRDITETKDALRRTAQAQRLESIGRLAGGVAHDFNNMLGVIVGYADMVSSSNANGGTAPKDPVLQKRVDTIAASAHRAAGLVKQLLAFAREGLIHEENVDMNEMLREMKTLLEHTIDKRIRITCSCEASEHIVRGDPSQLQNVVLNLALNARDAMPEGGGMHFGTRAVDSPAVSDDPDDSPGEATGYLEVSVSDTGVGMSEDVLSRVFNPFFTTKPPGKGSGLGLAGAYGIVKNHGGSIEAESEPGRGTIFRVLLPLSESDGACEGGERRQREIPQCRGHVLVVDDEENAGLVAAEMLKSIGCTAEIMTDSETAVEHFEKHHGGIDLVLVDLVMPGYDGRQCVAKLIESDPDVKVIMTSGFVDRQHTAEMLVPGVKDVITKPFTVEELARTVHRVTEGRSMPARGGAYA